MPDFEYEPVDHDPFAAAAQAVAQYEYEPVDHDPFALASTMTHWPEGPNPARPYTDAASNFASGGLQRALGLPNNFVGEALQNPDNQAAMGMALPWRLDPRFALDPVHYRDAGRLKDKIKDFAAQVDAGRTNKEIAASTLPNPRTTGREGFSETTIERFRNDYVKALGQRDDPTPSGNWTGTRGTPGKPNLKFMQGSAEDISPAELKEYLKIFEPVDYDPFSPQE